MPRPTVAVRPASADDLPVLRALWDRIAEGGGRSSRALIRHPSSAEVARRLAGLLEDSAVQVVVAVVDGDVVGMAMVTSAPIGPLSDVEATELNYVVVADGYRRRGVGKALVSAAAVHADAAGHDTVVATVLPSLRDANRFYARLGFAPVVVRRTASVPALRRRLAAPLRPADDLARRRSLLRPRLGAAYAAGRPLPGPSTTLGRPFGG